MKLPLATARTSFSGPRAALNAGSRLPFRVLLLVVSGYLYLAISVQRIAAASPWITGDWLINYADGFVRRGFIGEVCRQLHQLAGVDPLAALIAIKAILYATLCASLVILAAKRTIVVAELALLLSPAILPFEIYDPLGSGRKEMALLTAFAVYVTAQQFLAEGESSGHRRWQLWYLMLALPLMTLIHEGLFFFLPFFLAYEWVRRGSLDRRTAMLFVPPYAIACGALMLSWTFRGGSGTSAAICSSLAAMSLAPELCGGAVAALGGYDVHIGAGDLARYLALSVLTFVPLGWYGIRAIDSSRRRSLMSAACVALAGTLPLYLVSEDWGRWMHISAVLLFILVVASKDVSVRIRVRQPVLAVATFLLICLYVGSWEMPHWIHSPLSVLK